MQRKFKSDSSDTIFIEDQSSKVRVFNLIKELLQLRPIYDQKSQKIFFENSTQGSIFSSPSDTINQAEVAEMVG